jgi:hypothetical protein
MAFSYELKVAGNGGKWSSVSIRFATHAEASVAGLNKFTHWTMCEDYRVVEVEEAPTYRLVEGELREIPAETA